MFRLPHLELDKSPTTGFDLGNSLTTFHSQTRQTKPGVPNYALCKTFMLSGVPFPFCTRIGIDTIQDPIL